MTFSKNISAFQLYSIYRIMLKRIAKGYTAEQLAFLIGAPERYISDVESLERPFYTIDELNRITLALEESNPGSLYPSISNEDELKMVVYREQQHCMIVHTYCSVDKENNEQELFRLQEEDYIELHDLDQSETLDLVIDIIAVLIRSGYFYEPKLPCEVFQTVNSLQSDPLHPVYIQYALQRLCDDKRDDVKLRRIGSFIEPYHYEEC
jgi:transcriptional regulator with XRE-family HTH domain